MESEAICMRFVLGLEVERVDGMAKVIDVVDVRS